MRRISVIFVSIRGNLVMRIKPSRSSVAWVGICGRRTVSPVDVADVLNQEKFNKVFRVYIDVEEMHTKRLG